MQTARKLMKTLMRSPLTLPQRIEAFFHLTPHFAYPLLVLLSVLLLPALVLMPATNTMTMIMVDLPLCVATTGSLAAFYMLAAYCFYALLTKTGLGFAVSAVIDSSTRPRSENRTRPAVMAREPCNVTPCWSSVPT